MNLLSAGRASDPAATESVVNVEVGPGATEEILAMRGRREGTAVVVRSCSCLYNIAFKDPFKEASGRNLRKLTAAGTGKSAVPKSASNADRHRVVKDIIRIVTPFDPLKEGI
jgi:hypothetical protein